MCVTTNLSRWQLAGESIPGCVLQVYVWLMNSQKEVEINGRKKQPRFYGYIPDDNGLRGRCFTLMAMISALHNMSRSVGCALLAAAPQGGSSVFYFYRRKDNGLLKVQNRKGRLGLLA